jgi:ABC-type transporter Mla subunit MlaD
MEAISMENEFEHRLTGVETRLDAVERRQDDLDQLVKSVAVMASKQEDMEGDLKEIKADVKTLTEKPGKRWDTAVDKLLWALLAAVVAFLLAKIGL